MEARAPYTLDEWHRLHPWPAAHPSPGLEYLWHFDLPGDPEDVWRVIADTSRVNRALGRAEMTFEAEGGRRIGRARLGPVAHRWIEEPWSWVAGQWLQNVRVYERGYMKVVCAVQRVEPVDGGTRLYTYFGFVPRGRFGAAMIRLGFPSLERDYARLLPRLVGEAAPAALLAPPAGLAPDAEARLGAIAAELRERGLDARLVGGLVDFVRSADDLDVMRIQVRERARAWAADEDAVLSLFLHATRAGLLELSWDVVCPHCRGAVEEHGRAAEIPRDGACEVCAIDFATDDVVEITFHAHPSIRRVERRMFCSAEPAFKAHIRVNREVPAGASVDVRPSLAAGRWRMRLGGAKRYGYLDVAEGGAAEVTWRASDLPGSVAVAPGAVLRLVNDGAAPVFFVVESAHWSDSALRPGRLLSFQEFRDLFSEEYLGADVQLSVGEQTILFTDMVGSTKLYAARGDPAAFVEVKRHFEELFAIVRARRGAVVKTIGDATMAAFNDPLDAVKAAKAIHDAFPPGRADTLARLRVSLNTGPCIAVRLNANLDYFGSTVNVAAKLQTLAEAWQITMAEATWRAPGVAAWVAEQGSSDVEEVAYASRALRAPVAARRWTVYRAGAA